MSGEHLVDLLKAAGRQIGVRRGQVLIGRGAASSDVFLIEQGRFSVVLYSSEGREVAIRELVEGDIVGELAALDHRLRSSTVVAVEDARLWAVPSPRFHAILLQNPLAAMELVALFTAQIRRLTDRIFELSALSASQRLHCELLRLARPNLRSSETAVIERAPTHEQLAQRIGVRREAVTRELLALDRAGVLHREGRALVVPDFAQLQALVDVAYGESQADYGRSSAEVAA